MILKLSKHNDWDSSTYADWYFENKSVGGLGYSQFIYALYSGCDINKPLDKSYIKIILGELTIMDWSII